ncbi:nucleoside-diphosphate sugar epimerase/dehydratase [Carnobacterium divergens]|uniref:Polysaccharide biosynthesis protein n=1 Tax=Carnobacterium divergens TaxID=2748 RepID=A0A2R7ZYX8_CARDV|nr:nucleoside-diphosphate sugar epimerase/dehydratase [Carnobacterium divergens]MCO6018222.1 polysaccharide biosynthesis protein [Carnobacterium divergens]MPQ21945.1 polysaccharide biosynthesis protein [Carnobacterium divergens]TFI64646.1 polysaccharide biosynthesis protein [Carnobacterium divergens]TFI75026.1 polysaccharide biosynthesis protein [Carnobacterium divergens]TFI79389.1 polysaccharide biosynthesis protein [Carnobacterium divergens]
MKRGIKKSILIGVDTLAIVFSSLLSYIFLSPYIDPSQFFLYMSVGLCIISYLAFASYFKIFSKINRYVSIKEIINIFACVSLSFLVVTVISSLTLMAVSFRFILLTYIFSLSVIASSRIIWRILNELNYHSEKKLQTQRQIKTLVVGAGEGGSIFLRNTQKNTTDLKIVGVVDKDPTKLNTYLHGVPVIGLVTDIPEIVNEYGIKQITIAIPSLQPQEYEEILDICNAISVKVNLMPSVEDVLNGKLSVSRFREIDVVDLLGREEVQLDMEQISKKLTGKTVLVSGAGGSIGSEICRQVARFAPKRMILLGHGENSIYHIHQEMTKSYQQTIEMIPVIADIQDRQRIFDVMKEYQPAQVYHAAAHKHVPMMEYNPIEALKNNVYGTKNMAEASKEANVESFVMISTDKAVNPPNVMGATKRIAEMIVTGLNEEGKTKFAAVRFGNVLGSRGSVVPLFKEQIKSGGPLTVTDFRMTRYFMTIPEASRLVLQAGALAKGGEIFILDMGEPVKILDLAKKVIKLSGFKEDEIEVVETGIRPGEKLYEELLVDGEQTNKKVHDKIFVGEVSNYSENSITTELNNLNRENDDLLKERLINLANRNEIY